VDIQTAEEILQKLEWDEVSGVYKYTGTNNFFDSKKTAFYTWSPGDASIYRVKSKALEKINSFLKILLETFSEEQIKSV